MGGAVVNPTNCGEFLGELRNCYLIKKELCSIFCPLLVKFDIFCARYFGIRFCSFAPLVRSRIIRDILYENCILIYRTRILVVRTSEMWVYWKQYFGYTADLIHLRGPSAKKKKEVFGPCLHVVLNWQCILSKGKNLHTKYRGARTRTETSSEAYQGCGRGFNNIETLGVINFFFLQGKAPKEIHAILTETLACFLPGWAKDLSAPLYVWQHLEYSQPFRGPPNGRGPIQPYIMRYPNVSNTQINLNYV